MAATASKHALHVALDPLLILSMLQSMGVLTDCSNPSAKMAKIKEIKERYNQSVILNPKLKLQNSMDTVVSKLMTVDTDLIQSLRADVAEAGSFTNIYTYGLFSFGGLYPGMLARDTSYKEWMPVFTGSKASWRLRTTVRSGSAPPAKP